MDQLPRWVQKFSANFWRTEGWTPGNESLLNAVLGGVVTPIGLTGRREYERRKWRPSLVRRSTLARTPRPGPSRPSWKVVRARVTTWVVGGAQAKFFLDPCWHFSVRRVGAHRRWDRDGLEHVRGLLWQWDTVQGDVHFDRKLRWLAEEEIQSEQPVKTATACIARNRWKMISWCLASRKVVQPGVTARRAEVARTT